MKRILFLVKPLLLALVAAVISSAQPVSAQSVWNAASGNWSTAANWLPNDAAPSVGTNVLFADNGSAADPGTINNVVDTTLTIASLQYGQTNGFHNTLINSGVTLTVSNNTDNTITNSILVAGTETDNGLSQAETNTISGSGSLVINSANTNSVIVVRQASGSQGAHQSTLDMSGLDTFTASVGGIHIGVEEEMIPIQRPVGIWLLAKTNTITVSGTSPAFVIGNGHNNGGNGIVQLGITNAIFADSVVVGNSKSRTLGGAFPMTGSFLQFNPVFTNDTTPVLYLRGNSTSRVGTLSVGDNSAVGGGVLTTGTLDLSGGTVDAQVDTCYVGRGQNTNGTGTSAGTLTFRAGVIDVNTLEIGYVTTTNAVATATGTINVNSSASTLRINNTLRLGRNPGATATGRGTLNINSGTVLANSIISGSGITNTIRLNRGTLVISNSAGSASAPIGNFIATNNSTVQLGVDANATNLIVTTLTFDIDPGTNTLNITRVPAISAYPAQFPVIAYTNFVNTFNYELGSLPTTSPPLQGYLSNNVANSTVDLVLTNGPVFAPAPISLNFIKSGNVITFSWANSSFRLQSQTNTLNVGISSTWFDYPGGSSSPVNVTINPANPTVLFRLILP